MRFLVDENMPREIGDFLLGLGHDVLLVRDSELAGSTDDVVWAIAVEQARVLVTHDRDFPPVNPVQTPPGVILVRPRKNQRPAAILRLFAGFWAAVSENDLEGQVTVVSPGRVRRRPLSPPTG